MKSICVKDIMMPITDYATVSQEATLLEAVLALEKAQISLDPRQHKHRAVLVFDDSGKVISKMTMKSILIALEPNYGKLEGMGVLARSGYSQDLIKSMLYDGSLWCEPLQFICERATELKEKDIIQPPLEGEYVDANATMSEAIHQLIVYPYQSLLVKSGNEVIGILRLSDVFTKACDEIKACEI